MMFVPIGMAGDVMPVIDDEIVEVGEILRVEAGETYDFTELRIEGEVVVEGELFGQTIFVAPGGRLELNPGAVVTIADVEIDTSDDPHQMGNGILVAGELDVNGTEKTAYARLAEDAYANTSTLVFQNVPDDWEIGDVIAIADTRQLARQDLQYEPILNTSHPDRYRLRPKGGYWHETMQIVDIEGNLIRISEGLEHDHIGLAGNFPHVTNLTRDVLLRSENPDGTRGHLIGFQGAEMSIVGAQIDGFGRTTVDVLDSGQVTGGQIEHIGTNQVGRYAIHFHHVGTSGISEVRGTAINGSPKWGIGIHGTHFIDVTNNAVWQAVGAGIVTEDGNETGVVIEDNYAGASNGSGESIDGRKATPSEFAFEGAGIWLHGASQTVVRGNVSEGNAFSQYALFQFGDGSDPNKRLKVPKVVAAALSDPTQYEIYTQDTLRAHLQFAAFENNIAAGGKRGFDIWSLQTTNEFVGLTSWNTSEFAFADFYTSNAKLISDSSFFANPDINEGSVGISHQGAANRGDLDLSKVTVSGFAIGTILRPTGQKDAIVKSRLADVVFRDNDVGLLIKNGDGRHDTISVIDGIVDSIKLEWDLQQRSQLFRGDHSQRIVINGVDAYFEEQHPDYVVPNDKLFGYPGEGVTNQDLLDAGKRPTLGRLMPPDAFRPDWLLAGRLSHTSSVSPPIPEPTPEDRVEQLTFREFGTLAPTDVAFLTAGQIESIPNAYWFGTISAAARANLSLEQVQRLNVASRGTLHLLTEKQRQWLTFEQIRSVSFYDFPVLDENQIKLIHPVRFSDIPSAYWLSRIPAGVREQLTPPQVQNLMVDAAGMITYLTRTQISWLTEAQIQSLRYQNFVPLSSSQIKLLTPTQLASIPNQYWFSELSPQARAALEIDQVRNLQVSNPGIISLLTEMQILSLTETQIQTLHYADFRHLAESQVSALVNSQLESIPSYYWWTESFSEQSIVALSERGIQWLNDGVFVPRRLVASRF
ncbi:hypothetical protein Pla22_23170 [Rubripirellula amarantea]|uniref:CEMIP beta-helix domain-containing protein n=1 Tax=Rubripirellula amarantea TaxID=2527999 RepID=A0A5C5WVD8_9BACT|nr:right-handed parallel beta-helix repeat-containing protein [Rubripirellula amarantea]TWT54667.1 hypothetical protein Pla22_23170 [Rubripirellula amarantea]